VNFNVTMCIRVVPYLQNGCPVYPVYPEVKEIEGLKTCPDLTLLPTPVHGVSMITAPQISQSIVKQAVAGGVRTFGSSLAPNQNGPSREPSSSASM
jgi:predicted CoA-binding protein